MNRNINYIVIYPNIIVLRRFDSTDLAPLPWSPARWSTRSLYEIFLQTLCLRVFEIRVSLTRHRQRSHPIVPSVNLSFLNSATRNLEGPLGWLHDDACTALLCPTFPWFFLFTLTLSVQVTKNIDSLISHAYPQSVPENRRWCGDQRWESTALPGRGGSRISEYACRRIQSSGH